MTDRAPAQGAEETAEYDREYLTRLAGSTNPLLSRIAGDMLDEAAPQPAQPVDVAAVLDRLEAAHRETVEGDGSAAALFEEHDALPALVAAVRAVLAAHPRVIRGHPLQAFCDSGDHGGPYSQTWSCAAVEAVAAALAEVARG